MYGSIVVIKHSGVDGAAFEIEGPVATFGRSKDSNIRIMRNQVSQQHGRVFADNGMMCLENTSKKNPIMLGEGRLPPGDVVELQDQDVFAIAGRQFRYEAPRKAATPMSAEDKENAAADEKPFQCSEQEVIQDAQEVIKCQVDRSSLRRRISIEPDVSNTMSPAVRRKRNNSIPAAFSADQYEAAPPRRRSAFQPVAALPTPDESVQEEEEASSSEEEFLCDAASDAGLPTSVYAWKVAKEATEEPEQLEVATPQRAIANLTSNLSTPSILKTRASTPEHMDIHEEGDMANSVFCTPSHANNTKRSATTDGRQGKARVSFAKTDHVLLTPVSSKSRLKKSLLYKTPTKLCSPQERTDMLYQLNRKLTSDYEDDEEDFLAGSGDSAAFDEEEDIVASSDEESADVTDAMLASIRNSLPRENLVESPTALACDEELLDDSVASASSVEETDSEFLLSRPASARRGRRSLPAANHRNSDGRSRRKSASATPGETPDLHELRTVAEPQATGEESPSAAGITRTQAALKALASPIQRIASSSNIASSFIGVINSIVASPKPAPKSATPEPLKVRTLTSPITPQPHSRRDSVSTRMRFFTPSNQRDAKPRTPEEKRQVQKGLYKLWHHLRHTPVDGADACQPFKDHKNIFANESSPSCTIIEIYSAIQSYRVGSVLEFKDELLGMLDMHPESRTPGTTAHTSRVALLKAFNNYVSDLAEQGSPLVEEESLASILIPLEEDKFEATQEDMESHGEVDELDQHVDEHAASDNAAEAVDQDEEMAEAEPKEAEEDEGEEAQVEVEADIEAVIEAEAEAEIEAELEPEAEPEVEMEIEADVEAEESARTRRPARKSVMFDEQEEVCPVPKKARSTRRSRRSTVTEEEGQDVPEPVAVAPKRTSRRSRSQARAEEEEEEEAAPVQETVGAKRRSRRSAAPTEPAQKKAARRTRRSRVAEPEPEPEPELEPEPMEVEEAEEAVPAVDYNSWTCVVLKKELKKRNLPFNGRKADLVTRLEESDKTSATEETSEEETEETVEEVEEEVLEAPKSSRKSRKSRSAPAPVPEPMEVEEEEEQVEEAAPAVDYNSWTCVVLKKELKKRNLPFNGRKADLVARLEESDNAGGQAVEEAVEEAEPVPAPATRRTRRRR